MGVFSYIEELEIVESYAADNNGIASEGELSNRFDEDIAPSVIAYYGEDDEPAMNQAFHDWSDSLCKEGEIHELQCSQYCYVGRYSEGHS